MKIADNVYVLELEMDRLGQKSTIHPVLVRDGASAVLIDAGLADFANAIERQLEEVGASASDIDAFILSHQDLDHIGSLSALKENAPQAEVICHAAERPYIEGTKQFGRLDPDNVQAMLQAMPEAMRGQMEKLVAEAKAYKGVPVTRTVADGEVLPYAGGITTIHTPGHTEGHICLYLNESKVLVAGDELDLVDGELFGPKPGLSADEGEAYESIAKLAGYDIDTVVCYHGGVYDDNVRERIAFLTKKVVR